MSRRTPRQPADDPTPVVPIREYMRTDIGNAERFVAKHGADVHYVPEIGAWLTWDGRRWTRDESAEVERRAKSTVRDIYVEAARLNDSAKRAALGEHAAKSESNGRIRAMLERARAELGPDGVPITRPLAAFDADRWLLPLLNGTLELRTGTLRDHRREDRCRQLVPIAFDRDAECPRWLAFLDRILGGDADLLAFVQRAVGYSLTGDTGEQCLFFLHGRGANGKSTFLEVVRRLIGDYARQADFNTIAERRSDGPRNDVARLVGARLVTASELGEGKRLNEELVKSLTGGDAIVARFLHQEHFEFTPQFKLWIAANHKPVIRGTDDGIWRRVRLIPFEVQIPPEERDPNLLDALLEELPGILLWALVGCLHWQQQGLPMPKVVADATAAYREESDVMGAWLSECCVVGAGYQAKSSDLYGNYKAWAQTGSEYVMSQTAFGRRLQERGHDVKRAGDGSKWRVGLRLREAHDAPGQLFDDAAPNS